MRLLRSLRTNMALICMGFGLFAAVLVLSSWLYGYWSNGLYGTKFEIDSCWQGLSAGSVGLIGLFKWLVDSSKNSPIGEFPIAPKIINNPLVEPPVEVQPVNISPEPPVRPEPPPAPKKTTRAKKATKTKTLAETISYGETLKNPIKK